MLKKPWPLEYEEGKTYHMLEKMRSPGHLYPPFKGHYNKPGYKHVEARYVGGEVGFEVVGPWEGETNVYYEEEGKRYPPPPLESI